MLAFVLAVTMFPQISIVPPLYLLLRELRLIDTYPGLVLPYLTFAMPLTVWLLVGFFRQLPRELEEAARVDGAGRLRVLREIVLPLSAPGAGDDGDHHVHLLLERVPVRALLHARPGAADGAGGDRAVPRAVPGAVGPDAGRGGAWRRRPSRCWCWCSSGASCRA